MSRLTPMVRRTFTLTRTQDEWLKDQAQRQAIEVSKVLRRAIDTARRIAPTTTRQLRDEIDALAEEAA